MKAQRLSILIGTAMVLLLCPENQAHNVGNAITWNREISRIMYQRCASCHYEKGPAFSLVQWQDVQPRADAVKNAVLSRRMPPWGAVKGFGSFRNDQGLSQAEIDLITDWVDSNTPRGNNRNALPKEPKVKKPPRFKLPKNALTVSGEFTIAKEITLDGLIPLSVGGGPDGRSMKIVAVLPGGGTKPLVWLYEYKDSFQHPFLFREPVELPAGTVIRGVPGDATVALLPGKKR